MPHTIIDRRENSKGKSTTNRQKFIKRARAQVKEAVKDLVRKGSIGDAASSTGRKINIPIKDLGQPTFRHGEGGRRDNIHPGNKEFTPGDRVNRPPSGSGGGGDGDAGDQPGGEDSFSFHLTREEFLDLFFEDLELPDMVKQQIKTVDHFETRRAGFAVEGTPSRLNLLKTMRMAKSRKIGLVGGKKAKLKKLMLELAEIDDFLQEHKVEDPEAYTGDDKLVIANCIHRRVLVGEIEKLKAKIKKVPFIDDIDLRYNRWERVAVPATQAVMYCLMDVSASMDEWHKEMSKSFFMLMYLFLFKQYKRVEIVYIRHHAIAKVVDEEEFFHSRETGGTIVSSALELMYNHVQDNFPLDQWNIYACQCSDGDNFPYDREPCRDWIQKVLRIVQYFAYVEIDRNDKKNSDLWQMYTDLTQRYPHFNMNVITDASQIYPVFRKLFEKRQPTVRAAA